MYINIMIQKYNQNKCKCNNEKRQKYKHKNNLQNQQLLNIFNLW